MPVWWVARDLSTPLSPPENFSAISCIPGNHGELFLKADTCLCLISMIDSGTTWWRRNKMHLILEFVVHPSRLAYLTYRIFV